MGYKYYKLDKVPDLTLAQYSAEESGGVNEVIHQHSLFYRQLNRKGILFDEIFHIIYFYNPLANSGKRLSIYFRADGENNPVCMDEFMESSPLSTYFKFNNIVSDECLSGISFSYRASLVKQDGLVKSSYSDSKYYTVDPWKTNENARLIGLFRMMQKLQKPIAYVVSLKSVDMSASMQKALGPIMQFIRASEKSNIGSRDDNAEQTLRIYEKHLERLKTNPHFICRISTYAEDEAIAKMVLDSAAAEAIEEGNYRIVSENGSFQPFCQEKSFDVFCNYEVQSELRTWNSIFLLNEAVCFAMFPVLYPGETIEIPKESAPIYEPDGLYLGKDNSGYDVFFPLSLLSKHALITGVPGSGKTFSMLHIASQLAGTENNIPVLILEPAKKEYRALAYNKALPEITVFSPGGTGAFPLRINPFEFPIGCKLSEHITNLYQVFEGAFDLTPPLPIFVMDGIEEVYKDHGWLFFDVNDGKKTYPTTRELFDKIAELLEAKKYSEEIKQNLTTYLQVRIGSLLRREMGNVFDVSYSSVKPEEWLNISCVIELESLGSYVGNFLTLLLLTIVREMLRQNPKSSKEKPRHVIFLEEAHNLIGPTTVENSETGNTKVASTKYIVDMLAEVRALGEAIVIADQLPSSLAPQVTKNTSLKIGHRMTAADDRAMLVSTMSADGVQFEKMGSFQSGHALCTYENVQKPFEIQICKYSSISESPDNEELLHLLMGRTAYQKIMERDIDIFVSKVNKRVEILKEESKSLLEGKDTIHKNIDVITNSDYKGMALKYAKKILESNEEQYCRNVGRYFNKCVELILEIIEYARMNIVQKDRAWSYSTDVVIEFLSLWEIIVSDLPEDDEIFEKIYSLHSDTINRIRDAFYVKE